MSSSKSAAPFRCMVLSVVKHDYVPRGVHSHQRFDLTVVADDSKCPDWVHERNQEFADEFGIPYVRDVEKAIRDYHIDVAIVSSEAERHCDLAVRATKAGLHVVMDKPMSDRLSECEQLVGAVDEHNTKLLMWNRNFLPAIDHACQMIEAGEIGEPQAIHVDFYFSKDAGPAKGTRQSGDPPIDWLERQLEAHADGSDGGVGRNPLGELEIEGIYPLAYIRRLMGAEVQKVFARTASFFHQANVDNDVDDLATVTLEMERGLLGTLCIGRIGAASHPDIGEIKLHVVGSQGGLVVSEARPEVRVYYRGQPEREFRSRRVAIDDAYHLMQNFADAIDNDNETMLDAKAGRAICAIVDAAIQSGRSGKPELVK
jgi:predicted dehydrogenase